MLTGGASTRLTNGQRNVCTQWTRTLKGVRHLAGHAGFSGGIGVRDPQAHALALKHLFLIPPLKTLVHGEGRGVGFQNQIALAA